MTAGMLPEAEIAFLDEIFKANSAILNAFLTLLNERKFKMGATTQKCPLEICIGASNELPEGGEALEALYDRFTLRRWVDPIRNDDNFEALWDLVDDPCVGVQLDLADVATLRDALRNVDTTAIKPAITTLRRELASQHGIVPSDRRWRAAKKLIQAHALLNGRMVALPEDVLILAESLWDKPQDRAAIYGLIASTVAPDLAEALRLYDAAVEAMDGIDFNDDSGEGVQRLASANQALKGIVTEMRKLDSAGGVHEHVERVVEMQAKVARAAMARLGF
jgi:MoxR-like ATPase